MMDSTCAYLRQKVNESSPKILASQSSQKDSTPKGRIYKVKRLKIKVKERELLKYESQKFKDV